jgi:hypothetical protein
VKDSQDSSGGVGCIEGSIRVFIEMSISDDGYVAGPKLQRSQPALVRQKFWRWIDESDPWNRGLYYRAGQILNPLPGDELVSVLHLCWLHSISVQKRRKIKREDHFLARAGYVARPFSREIVFTLAP